MEQKVILLVHLTGSLGKTGENNISSSLPEPRGVLGGGGGGGDGGGGDDCFACLVVILSDSEAESNCKLD